MNSMLKSYKNRRIEFHILQSFPVTCLNRDDVGAPKTALVGGVTRARVSSQCWKRQVRLELRNFGVTTGIRTKLLSKLIERACIAAGANAEKAKACGEKIEKIFVKGESKKEEDETEAKDKSDTLIFLAPAEVALIAEKFREKNFEPDQLIKKDAKKPAKELGDIIGKPKMAVAEDMDGLDIALFGRMVAQAPSMDVEAAASFSHAISTHKVSNEVEFFTALDDYSSEQGSAHMGSLEFNSGTYYRYISLDLGQLYQTLGGEEFFPAAIAAFIKALFVAIPSARQTTQSGASLWDFAKVLVRDGQRIQLSCETPVKARDGGYLQPSIDYVSNELAKKEKLSGSLFGKVAEFTFGLDETFSIDELVKSVVSTIKV